MAGGQVRLGRAATTTKQRPRVYSYARFSTPEQAEGESERRQDDAAARYAKRVGLLLDQSLTDRGLSAYHGHHRTKGALGGFLKAIEAGAVPPGSVLFVENVDRLTREGMIDALRTVVFGVIEHDVAIATLDETYTRESLDTGKINELIGELRRAHRESKRKADLTRDNWEQKRRRVDGGAEKFTARRKAWLAVKKESRILSQTEIKQGLAGTDFEFVLIPEMAEAVRRIFEWKRDGVANRKIVKRLNEERQWPWLKSGWMVGYVKRILRDRAVIGELQPHRMHEGKRVPAGEPIKNYYPPVVKRALFDKVQTIVIDGRGRGRPAIREPQLFTNIARCAYCGGQMHVEYRGKGRYIYRWLYCNDGRRGRTCCERSIRYDQVEKVVLDNCRRLRPEAVLPDPDEQERRCRELHDQVDGLQGEATDIERRIKNLIMDQEREDRPASRDRIRTRIHELEDRKGEIEEALRGTEHKLEAAEAGRKSVESWSRNLTTLQRKLSEGNDPDLRLRVKAHLREFIDHIDLYTHGFPKRFDSDEDVPSQTTRQKRTKSGELVDVPLFSLPVSDDFGDYLEDVGWETGLALLRNDDGKLVKNQKTRAAQVDPRFRQFVEDVMRRRMSKEGRFVRVWFKSGGVIDLVPDGSLASGTRLGPEGTERVQPSVAQLWSEYSARHQLMAEMDKR